MINLKFQSGALFGIIVGMVSYRYLDLMPIFGILTLLLFVLSIIFWIFSDDKGKK